MEIDKEVIDPDDAEMLEDLLTAALNEALAKVQSLQMGQLAGLAGGLGLKARWAWRPGKTERLNMGPRRTK